MPEPLELHGAPRPIDPVEAALLAFTYGVHVIGSRAADGTLNAMIADWVMQVSFSPRLVAVSIENDARTLRFVRETGAFTINLLKEATGATIARRVVMPAEGAKIRGRSAEAAAKVTDKLAAIPHWLHPTGVPVLEDALGWIACEAVNFFPTGDHTLVVGRVLDGERLAAGDALSEKELGWEYAG